MSRVYSVYKGEQNGVVVYIGTTIQKPADRFRWHKHNGKPSADKRVYGSQVAGIVGCQPCMQLDARRVTRKHPNL